MPSPEGLEPPAPPTRVGATPIGDAVAAAPAQESAIKAQALFTALWLEGFPVVRSAGAVSIEIAAAAIDAGGVRMLVQATRDGQPIAGWDPDRVHVTPPADFVAHGEVREDPLALCVRDLLEYAAHPGG